MLYIKDARSQIPIRADNAYALCSKCGKEVRVQLTNLFKAETGDPLSDDFMCPDCTKAEFRKRRPTKMDIVSLVLALSRLGYSRQVLTTFNNYDIENISELHPDAYENFAKALLEAVPGGEAS